MKKKNILIILILIMNLSSVLAFNNSLNETNSQINLEFENQSSSNVNLELNPFKNKESKEIFFKDVKFKPKDGINANIKTETKSLKQNNKVYSLIQLNENPSKGEIIKLKSEGIELLEYISSNSWYASINKDIDDIIETDSFGDLKLKNNKFNNKFLIKNIDEIKSELILSKNIRENKIGKWAKDEDDNIFLNIQFHKDFSLTDANEKLFEKSEIIILSQVESINTIIVSIPESQIYDLLKIKEIKRIEIISPSSEDKLINSIRKIGVNILQSSPYLLTGNGIKILQYEDHVPADGNSEDHPDLVDRVEAPEWGIWPFGDSVGDHATHVAGIMIGNGSLNSSYKGIATKAKIVAYETDYSGSNYNNSNDLEDEYLTAINSYNANLASNSWGVSSTEISNNCNYLGTYTLVSELLDNLTISKKFPIIWANGNERQWWIGCGNYDTTLPKASAKNVISVGAINSDDLSSTSFSSYGPTNDGRIKPELVAPGAKNSSEGIYSTVQNKTYKNYLYGNSSIPAMGTSMSAPHVSGTIALMLEQWNKSGYQSSIGDPLPSTIKALLLDSTTDLSSSGNGDKVIDGPDYKNGFGLLNATGAVDRIIAGTFKEKNISSSSDVDVYSINISSQNELKVTMAWDDPAGSILYNDLDLKLISPSGVTFYPWTLNASSPSDLAKRDKEDHINNVEQVYVNSSEIESGEWLVVVSATSCTTDCPQKYSLVSEENISTELTSLNADSSLITYLKLDNNALDSSNLSNHGIEYGSPSYNSNGHNNYSIIIDGVNDYINLADKTEYHISDFTLSFWVKFDTINQPEYIFFKDRSGNYNGDFHIRTTTNNKIYVQLQTGSSQSGIESNHQFDSNWTHILFTGDGTTNKLYINGKLDSSLNFNWNLNSNNLPLYIGSWAGIYVIDGEIDDFSFWNRSLENYEIAKLYQSNILLSSSEAPSYEPLQANSSLIGHYKLENNAQDSSNNNDGTSYGSLSYTTGYENTGADFDGVNDYIQLNHSSMYQTSKISMSFWLKLDNNDSAKYIIFKDRSGNYNGDFHMRTYDSDLLIQLQTGSSQASIQSNIPLSTTDWMHIVFTSDGSSNKLYINGLLDNSNSFSWNMNSNNLPIYLGGWAENYGINGKMDEVSIWNTTLSSNEVLRLYNEGITY